MSEKEELSGNHHPFCKKLYEDYRKKKSHISSWSCQCKLLNAYDEFRPTPKPIEGDEVEDGDSVEAMDIRMEIVDIYANDELKSDNEELNSIWKQDCLKILIADRLAKAGYSKRRLRELDEEEVFRLVNTLKLFTVLTKDHPHVNTLTVHSGKILAKAICLKFGSQKLTEEDKIKFYKELKKDFGSVGLSLEVDRTLLTMTLVNVARQSSNEEEYAENLAKAIEDGTIFNVQVKK